MVQVIGIGYGRTGTESLKEALTILGYETFHTKSMMLARPELLDLWYHNTTTATSDDNCPLDLEVFLQGYTAATGMMLAICWKKVFATFPEAHYILTRHKSPEQWFQSWSLFIDSISLLPRYAPWLPRVQKMDAYHQWLLASINADSPVASYQAHLEAVRQRIPEHQLLELPISDSMGWGPLCDYLNVSVPVGMKYPHLGRTQTVAWQCRFVVVVANLSLLLVLYGLTKGITRLFSTHQPRKELPAKQEDEDRRATDQESDQEAKEEEEYIPKVRILPEDNDNDDDNQYLLSVSQRQQLAAQALPPMVALRCWKRLYRLSRDGDDFSTFLNATKGNNQTLIIVQTTRQQLLGAFADSPWDKDAPQMYTGSRGRSYYGSTLACLFTFDKSSDDNPQEGTIYKWSGRNRYIQLLDVHKGRIAFGGGDDNDESGFGLLLQDNFSKGTSSPCETFGNPCPLTGGDEQFAILDVEVWTFPHGTLA